MVTPVALLGGFAWWAAALEITILYALGAVACWWMLTRVFGANPRIIAPLTFYLFSPLLLPAITWWAAAINLVAVQAPLFVVIGSHVQYLRTRERRWLVLIALMLLVVSGVYAKGLVVAAVLGLFTACYALDAGGPARRIWVAVRRWWPVWCVYTVIGAATGAAYLMQTRTGSGPQDQASASDLFENLVLRNLVPALVGGPWTWIDVGGFPRQLADASDLGVALALTAVVGAFAFAVQRWHNAWLPLLFLAPAFIATFLAMSSLRTASFPFLALEPRYWADTLPYLVLAFGVTIMAIPGFPEVRRRRSPEATSVRPPLVLAIGAAYIVGSFTTTVSYVEPWHTDYPARLFVTTALAEAADARAELVVANDPAPGAVMSSFLFPSNTPNYLFAPSPGQVRGVDGGVDLDVLDPFGRPVPALASADMELDVSGEKCFVGSGRLMLESATLDYPFWATVSASFDASTTVHVTAGTARHEFEVPSGRHRLTFRTVGAFDRVWLVSEDESTTICPESVRVGAQLEVP
ncbi:hypothetical protein [Aeromicrobium sp.]|uniref:hypothetical protein n=1 Tax=Aeromicrobium sp. TaxID=1871063 RepID=UPI0028B23D55|nr:hypothetical protein [Aeromicrobium sp.]